MYVKRKPNIWEWISLLGLCMMIVSMPVSLRLPAATMFAVGGVMVVFGVLAATKLAERNRDQRD